MNISSSLLGIIIFIFLYLIIAEVFTVLFRLMGMPTRKARFQVISLMTNSGYTTDESEIIVNSKKRRKLAMATMLFGYTFTVTAVSTLVNLISTLFAAQSHNFLLTLTYITSALLIIFVVHKLKFIRRGFDNLIIKLGNKYIFDSTQNQIDILDVVKSSVVAEVRVSSHLPPSLEGKTVLEAGIRKDYGIQVLAIIKQGTSISSVSPGDYIEKTDKVILFGELTEICRLFEIKIN